MNNKMFKFTFVILHYKALEDTIECIDSILKNIDYPQYDIVVVDNGSMDGSNKELREKYNDNSQVNLIVIDKNLGFAKGNNLGYEYSKNNLKSNFIILVNNDTLFHQNEFISIIVEKYNKTAFDIMGPDIVSTKDGLHQNPQLTEILSKRSAIKLIVKFGVLYILNFMHMEQKIVQAFRKIKLILNKYNINKNIDCSTDDKHWIGEQWGKKLHGSCLILSPRYVKKYRGLFDRTFMYVEEDILHYICKVQGLSTVYEPNLKIFHKEDSSTDLVYNTPYRKRKFIYYNTFKSAFILLYIMLNKKCINNFIKI